MTQPSAPYVFARQKLAKPFHAEVNTHVLRPVLCQHACGLYYVTGNGGAEDACPDCGEVAPPWRIGEPEEVEVCVRMAFGNVDTVEFHRATGLKVTQRPITLRCGNRVVVHTPEGKSWP